MAGAVCVPIALVLAALVSPLLTLLALFPLVVYEAPVLGLREKASQRKEGVERELPFFSILANVLGGAGVPLYETFAGVADDGAFRAMKREAQIVRRDVEVFGMNAVDSFERLADRHPSKKFSNFLTGYTSKVRSGGDIPSYLLGESGSLLRELEDGWTRYSARVGVIGSLMVTVFGVVPLLLLVVGFFSPGTSVSGLTAFALAGVPTMSVALVYMAGSMQPVGDEPLKGDWKVALLTSAVGLAAGLVLGGAWLGAALSSGAFFVAYGLSVRGQMRVMRETDDALPRFLKDMLEFKRQEHDIGRSLMSVAAQNRYAPAFDSLLTGLAAKLRYGVPLDEAKVEVKTGLGKVVFFVLGQMGRSGGGSVETMFQLSEYTSRTTEMKKNGQAEVKPYLVLSFFTPLLLAFGVAFVGSVLSSFGSVLHGGVLPGEAGLPGGKVTPQLAQAADLLIATSAAGLGVVGAKISDLTARNTLRASVNVGLATVAVLVAPALGTLSVLHASL